MYYEEKIIDGVLCYRYTPKGEFRPMSAERIVKRIKDFEMLIAEKFDQMDKMYSKEEVEELIGDAINSCTSGCSSHNQDFKEWVAENLTK